MKIIITEEEKKNILNMHLSATAKHHLFEETGRSYITLSAYPNEKENEFTFSEDNKTLYYEITNLPEIKKYTHIEYFTLFGEGMTTVPAKTQKNDGTKITGEIDGTQLGKGVIKTLIYHIKSGGKNMDENKSMCNITYTIYTDEQRKIATKDSTPVCKFVNLNNKKMDTLKPTQIQSTTPPSPSELQSLVKK